MKQNKIAQIWAQIGAVLRNAALSPMAKKVSLFALITALGTALGMSQTDATVLATNMTGALAVVGPVAITLAGFFLILRLSKRAGRA
jgi:hypothetical protein